MKPLLPIALSLLATDAVRAFAPSPISKSPLRRARLTRAPPLFSVSPQDLSFLIADASAAVADVVANVANVAAVAGDAVSSPVDAAVAVDAVDAAAASAVADVVANVRADVVAGVAAVVGDGAASAPVVVDEASTAATTFDPTYSKASYYTTLGLYGLSFPGLWSQIKRSTKAKVKRKTYVSDGEAAKGGKELRQQAGEIMAYMKANNYEVAEAGETIVFQGLVARSTSQAFFLVFCTVIGLASLALVLQIQFQDLVLPFIGKPNWFLLVLASPYAGIYYWKSGDRIDDMRVKLSTNDDETLNQITIEGNDEEIDRMWRTLELREKGMVKVEGILG